MSVAVEPELDIETRDDGTLVLRHPRPAEPVARNLRDHVGTANRTEGTSRSTCPEPERERVAFEYRKPGRTAGRRGLSSSASWQSVSHSFRPCAAHRAGQRDHIRVAVLESVWQCLDISVATVDALSLGR